MVVTGRWHWCWRASFRLVYLVILRHGDIPNYITNAEASFFLRNFFYDALPTLARARHHPRWAVLRENRVNV